MAGVLGMTLKATDVFVPGAYPQHTYVTRAAEGLEETLRDSLSTAGQIISLSGPSKSGKTVLVENVVGRGMLIQISGATIHSPDDVWKHVLDWMDVPSSTSKTRDLGVAVGGEIGAKGGLSIPLIAKAEASGTVKAETTSGTSTGVVRERRGLAQVVHEIAGSDFVVLLDDFHHMDRAIQTEVAKILKEAVRLGVKIVTAAVSHRGDDVVRANPELRGRVRAIDLRYWTHDELYKIADVGFKRLNAEVDDRLLNTFANESAGSPQLMQLLCLQACFVLDLREKSVFGHPPLKESKMLSLIRS